jgi:hypothetical protein
VFAGHLAVRVLFNTVTCYRYPWISSSGNVFIVPRAHVRGDGMHSDETSVNEIASGARSRGKHCINGIIVSKGPSRCIHKLPSVQQFELSNRNEVRFAFGIDPKIL